MMPLTEPHPRSAISSHAIDCACIAATNAWMSSQIR
jgi:hypothetical protein